MELERKDVQGLIVSSYKHLPCAAYLLLQVKDAGAAKAWLACHVGAITTAETKHPYFSTNVAFTYDGLQKLGLNQEVLATFSFPFQEGMATEHRSRILGDGDENAPSNWEWGGAQVNLVGLLLLIYARDESVLRVQLERWQQELAGSGGFGEPRILDAQRQPKNNPEHFGFHDGIGQPVMEGTGNKQRQQERTHHATELPAGEFLLGHTNLYGATSDTPVVRPEDDPQQLLPTVPDSATALGARPGMHDLGRDGTYLVFRQLAQDVAKFWNFLDKATSIRTARATPRRATVWEQSLSAGGKAALPWFCPHKKMILDWTTKIISATSTKTPAVLPARSEPTSAALILGIHSVPILRPR